MARNYVVPLGLLSLASDPTGHSAGETYYNTTSNKVRVYSGASWQDAGLQGTVGTQGVQGTQGPNAALVVSSTPPSGPLIGDRWVDSNSGSLYTWNYDGNSYSWVEFDASGYVGAQGVQGTQGTQGVSGSGTQGTQGAQGLGTQGVQGTIGANGSFGGAAFDYFYTNTSTADTDPTSGYFKFDSTTLSSVTTLYINKTDHNAVSADSFLQTIDDSTSAIKGHFSVMDETNEMHYAIFAIVGNHTEHATYLGVPVSYLSGVTSFANGQDSIITFARTGDKGDTGLQGTQGATGTATQGTQGATGTASAASPTFTGTVTLPTSTNTVAPLILPTGVLLTSPAAGVIESDGTAPYITESVTTGRSLIDTSFIATNGVYAAPLLSATSAQPLWGGFTSATGTLGTPTGTGPWTVVVTGMSATGGFIPGKTITATAGTGSFNTNTVTIVSVDSATQITVSATGGTIPTAGTVTVVKVSTTGALTLLANTAYTFEQMLYVTTGATSHTTAIGFSGTVGVGSIWHQTDSALTGVSGTIQASGSSGLSTIAWTTLAGGVVEATTTAAQTAWRTKGMLRTTTSGTIIPQITFSAAPTAPNSLSATSFFRITPIGSNTLYNIGAWA